MNVKPLVISCVVAAAGLAVGTPTALAITITMEYSDEGDLVPHDENPAWDPDGSILKAHFQAAKEIWERLLPGPGEFEFDFHWDNDIGSLGLTTHSLFDTYVEINPDINWFVDPTPFDDVEFGAITQMTYSQLPSDFQSTYFPGTAPPGVLEVGYRRDGLPVPSASGVPGTDAKNAHDLLSTIVHEIGHVLGISGTEPGEYNLLPQHVGGLFDVLVAEDDDSGHLGGDGKVPFLMCEGCGNPGVRRYPTATDVLVIAEDQGITDVHLQRVDRIYSGDWYEDNVWIGGAAPDETQDVFVRHGGSAWLNGDAAVRSLVIARNSTVEVMNNTMTILGPLTYMDGSVFVGTGGGGGTLVATEILGDPDRLKTTPDTHVQFNQFSPSASATATAVDFQGRVTIGVADSLRDPDSSPTPVVFNPSSLATWTVADELRVGAAYADTTLVINNHNTFASGSGFVGAADGPGASKVIITGPNASWDIGGDLHVRTSGRGSSELQVNSGGRLHAIGEITIANGGRVLYQGSTVTTDSRFEVLGGDTGVLVPPLPQPPRLEHTFPGSLVIADSASAMNAQIRLEGGAGNGALGGSMIFRDGAYATSAQIVNGAGRQGESLPLGTTLAGFGGLTRFEDRSFGSDARIVNEGVTQDGGGSGGRTSFTDNSTAQSAVIDNLGSTYLGSTNLSTYAGGATEFIETTSAANATLTNYLGRQYLGVSGSGRTAFFDQATAERATIVNQAGTAVLQAAGETHFRGSSRAELANITNQGTNTTFGGATRFFDSSTAEKAMITNAGAYATTEFNNSSNAGEATIEISGSSGTGGRLFFKDDSSAASSKISVRPFTNIAAISFENQSTAEGAQITFEGNSQASIVFRDQSTAGAANIHIGSRGALNFQDSASMGRSVLDIQSSGQLSLGSSHTTIGGATGEATIFLRGANADSFTPDAVGALLTVPFGGNAGDATIFVQGGTVPGARGATANFQGRAGNAVISVQGGVNGGNGALLQTRSGFQTGAESRLIIQPGGTVRNSAVVLGGDISFGSIEGDGAIELGNGQTRLVTGSRNVDTTFSGRITGSGDRLTKVGTGVLTLSGDNTYTGATAIEEGTLLVTGSLAGSATVNSGAVLLSSGTIAGAVTVNSGGLLAPGASPGTANVGGLMMSQSGSRLEIELAGRSLGTDYDQIRSTGVTALGGMLDVDIAAGFIPAAGDRFTIIESLSSPINGVFESTVLPSIPNFSIDWKPVAYNTNDVTLEVLSVASFQGDFNADGAIDASDYAVWRESLGKAGLPAFSGADADGDGSVTTADYNFWRINYGSSRMIAASQNVPEPASLLLALLAAPYLGCRFNRRTRS